MASDELFLNCLRNPVDAWRHGVLSRYDAVALMATCIDIYMTRPPAPSEAPPESGAPRAIPALLLDEPLSEDDRFLKELYAEATVFWSSGLGKLRLIK
jgi:hypothetical protein